MTDPGYLVGDGHHWGCFDDIDTRKSVDIHISQAISSTQRRVRVLVVQRLSTSSTSLSIGSTPLTGCDSSSVSSLKLVLAYRKHG
jgi:hypothetical protein